MFCQGVFKNVINIICWGIFKGNKPKGLQAPIIIEFLLPLKIPQKILQSGNFISVHYFYQILIVRQWISVQVEQESSKNESCALDGHINSKIV